MNGTYTVLLLMRLFFIVVSLSIQFSSSAQLCTGSLGDPVVNITFGSGANSDPGFSPPVSYTYTTSTCPNDGFYTITSSSTGCFNGSWHSVTADHTGNGAFMLVNASQQPADFFVKTVTELCPNTTYEFSAWILNILKSASGIQPNITFNIETLSGTVLMTFNTGNIAVSPQPVWKQYGFFFTTTALNPSIILRITNNAPGGVGNDLAMDDITFRPCGPVLTSSIRGNSDKVDICVYDQSSYTFVGTISTGFFSPVFQWQESIDSGAVWRDIPGANNLIYQRPISIGGNYWYRLTVAESGNAGLMACRIGSNMLTIKIHPKPVIDAGPDKMVVAGGHTVLAATAGPGNNVFTWSPPDHLSNTSILNPTVTPDRDMAYIVSALSEFGCINEDQVLIKVVAGIFIPTAFTPNNDGKNDFWRIPFLDPGFGATVRVYNRWGQAVYEATGVTVNWNGNYKDMPQPAGTYVYQVHFTDGTPDMKGTVNLIR